MKRIANECFFAWVESEIKSGRSVKFRVKGNSMMPLLRNGKDEVVVGPYDKEELKLFDVILFRQTDRYVLHRIIQFFSHLFVGFQFVLPSCTDFFFTGSFHDLFPYGTVPYQQVEPLRAGKELVRFPKVLISLIIGDDVF